MLKGYRNPARLRTVFGLLLFLLLAALCCAAGAEGGTKILLDDTGKSYFEARDGAIVLTPGDVEKFTDDGNDSCTLVLADSAANAGISAGTEFLYFQHSARPWFLRAESVNGKTVRATDMFSSAATDGLMEELVILFRDLMLPFLIEGGGTYQIYYDTSQPLDLNIPTKAALSGTLNNAVTVTFTVDGDSTLHVRIQIDYDFNDVDLDIELGDELKFPIVEFPFTPLGDIGPKFELAFVAGGEGSGQCSGGNIYNTFVCEFLLYNDGRTDTVKDPEKPVRPENSFDSIQGDMDLKLVLSAAFVLFDIKVLDAEAALEPGIHIKVGVNGDDGGNPSQNVSADAKTETWHYCRAGDCFHGAVLFDASFVASIGFSIPPVRIPLVEYKLSLMQIGIFGFYYSYTFKTSEFGLHPEIVFVSDIPSICPYVAHRVDVNVVDAATGKPVAGAELNCDPGSELNVRIGSDKQYEAAVLRNVQNKTDKNGNGSLFVPDGKRSVSASGRLPNATIAKGSKTFYKNPRTEAITIELSTKPVTVNFNPNISQDVRYMPSSQTGIPGTLLELWGRKDGIPTRPETDGYMFIGWSTDPNASPDDSDLLTDGWGEFSDNMTLYAVWKQHFTVRFLNWDGSLVIQVFNVPYGTRFGVIGNPFPGPEPVRPSEGYYDYYFQTYEPGHGTIPIVQDTDFTATFEAVPKLYTVNWMNGDRPMLEEKYHYLETPVYKGETPTKASSGETRYVFAGWDPSPAPITNHITYNAKFIETKDHLAVTFDCAGGGPVPEGQIVAPGACALRPEPDPVRSGYTFRAWTLNGVDYDFSAPVYQDLILKADWTPVAYRFTAGDGKSWQRGSNSGLRFTVSRDPDDGQAFSLFTGAEIDGKAADPARYTAEAGSVRLTLSPGLLESLDSGKHTLKALFKDGEAEAVFYVGFDPRRFFTVQWEDDLGNVLETDDMVPEGSMPSYEGPTPKKAPTATESYIFTGWTPEIVPVTANATYTAVFAVKPDGFAVTFETDGGFPVPPVQTVPSGGTAVVPDPAPSKTGYELSGWLLNGEPYDFAKPVLSDLTLTAAWTPVTYAVTSGNGLTWYKGTNGGAYFIAERNILKEKTWPLFSGVKVDGMKQSGTAWFVNGGDDFVEIMLTPACLEALGEGTHRLTVCFTDGEAEAVFTVKFDLRDWYTVWWVNDDGMILEKDEMVPEGTVPAYHGDTPQKAPTEKASYVFSGWEPEPAAISADTVYRATYTVQPTPVPTVVPPTGDSADFPLWISLILLGLLGLSAGVILKSGK